MNESVIPVILLISVGPVPACTTLEKPDRTDRPPPTAVDLEPGDSKLVMLEKMSRAGAVNVTDRIDKTLFPASTATQETSWWETPDRTSSARCAPNAGRRN